MNPTLTVLLYGSLAASASALGALPLIGRERLPLRWIGWANAMAAGLMMGAAYVLMAAGFDSPPAPLAAGALLGMLAVYAMHAAAGTEDLDLNRLAETPPEYGFQVLLVSTLHSAAEGVAIGAAMLLDLPLGIFMAVAIAVHNVPEGAVLATILRSRGVSLSSAASLAVITKASQVLLAVFTFAVVSAAPAVLPWTVGFAVGALIYLVMAELLPECYREAGHTSIALVTILAMGIVVLIGGAH